MDTEVKASGRGMETGLQKGTARVCPSPPAQNADETAWDEDEMASWSSLLETSKPLSGGQSCELRTSEGSWAGLSGCRAPGCLTVNGRTADQHWFVTPHGRACS